ncbi:MAG: hypothetical protein JXQ71_11095 [Verrucomicrobia bacterium]|nr:hypothetical protein [Verrucomicrobiota bacterium]
MKTTLRRLASILILCIIGSTAHATPALSILWVSDNGASGFSGPAAGSYDDAFVTLLQNAGHTVSRYNPPDSGQLPPADITQINTYDLVILGRALNSTAFQASNQAAQWNTAVTRPVLVQSSYLLRNNRLGWFTGDSVPNGTPTPVTALDLNDPPTAYIFAGVAMSGNVTANPYDEAVDQNTSHITSAIVSGGHILARATISGTPPVVAVWPAGTAVRAGADILAGFRMYFPSGSREAASPISNAGKENLTATGESMFLAAVGVAAAHGEVPLDPGTPVGFTVQPVSASVLEPAPATFSAIVTGAPPRFLQWQRSDDGGTVFNDIPGATATAYTLAVTVPTDDGAIFRLLASNHVNVAYSDPATLSVTADTTPPEVIGVRSDYPFRQVLVTFSEPVLAADATDPFQYAVLTETPPGLSVTNAAQLTPSHVLLTLDAPLSAGSNQVLGVAGIRDVVVAANWMADTNVAFATPFLTCGYVRVDTYSGISGTPIANLTNAPKFPHLYDATRYFTSFASPVNEADNYGSRWSGFLRVPTNGVYSFFLRSDDQAHFCMNTNDVTSMDPAGKVLLAYTTGANTGFSTNTFQRATNVSLNAGQSYYVELLHKEGTGGDYARVLMRSDNEPFPGDGDLNGIPGEFLCAFAETATLAITLQPVSQTNLQNRTVTFTVEATVAPTNQTLSYQWRKNGLAIPGATGPTFTTDLLTYPDDDGAVIDVVLTAPGGSVTSAPVTLGVLQDLTPPAIASVASLDGWAVCVCFDELLATNAATGVPFAIDLFSYAVDGGETGIVGIEWGPDDSTVVLHLATPVTGSFQIEVFSGLGDRAGNETADSLVASSEVLGWTAMDVGSPAEPGSTFACTLDRVRVVAGGADIWGTADQMHYVWTEVSGDFDIRVRVEGLVYRDANSKAGVLARASTNADSANVGMFVTPPPPGTDRYSFQWRDTAAASSSSRHRDNSPDAPTNTPAYPNAWLRLVRSGDVFTGYLGNDGIQWVLLGSRTNAALPELMVLGLATTAHNDNPGQTTVAVYRNLFLARRPTLLNPAYAAGNLTFQFRSDRAVPYTVWFKDALDDPEWTPLETRTGDGNTLTVTHTPSTPTGFYQVTSP